jgi:hypothetical protein
MHSSCFSLIPILASDQRHPRANIPCAEVFTTLTDGAVQVPEHVGVDSLGTLAARLSGRDEVDSAQGFENLGVVVLIEHI